MEQKGMIDLLRQVASGTMDVEQAALKLKEEPFEDLGFAKIDHHRAMRQGVAEVIYGEGKTPEQIFRIAEAMKEKGQKAVLITRMNKESAIYVPAASAAQVLCCSGKSFGILLLFPIFYA